MSCAVRMQGINALGVLRLDEGPTKDVLGLLRAVPEPVCSHGSASFGVLGFGMLCWILCIPGQQPASCHNILDRLDLQ